MATQAEKRRSIAEWDALVKRYPLGSRWDFWRQLAFAVLSNAVTVYFLVTHRMQPLHLVYLVALEALVLTAIAWIQTIGVPREARFDQQAQPLGARLGTLAFGLFWLGAVYSLVFGALLGAGDQLRHLVSHPIATLREGGLQWPLAVTAIGAIFDAVRDARIFRASLGESMTKFVSTPGLNGIARWLTLILGGIPFMVPMTAVAWTVFRLTEPLRRSSPSRDPGVAILVLPLLCLGVFGVMFRLVSAGLSGWAIGYCSAKLASETFLLALPWIASKARTEEAAAL
ncbi:MAG TPA: hypothetical protein VN783_03660 [Thermoanaerobaculia bacterium]|nr:hypothetical protein [Thermoanaerobaculia bacterium]